MNILDFTINYPDEEPVGKIQTTKTKWELPAVVVIARHYWLENKQAYRCWRCQARQALRSGTVISIPTCHTVTGSWPCTCSRLPGLLFRRRDTATAGAQALPAIWEMVNKLRDVMGKRDDKYTLEGAIELDDAFFSTEISVEEKENR